MECVFHPSAGDPSKLCGKPAKGILVRDQRRYPLCGRHVRSVQTTWARPGDRIESTEPTTETTTETTPDEEVPMSDLPVHDMDRGRPALHPDASPLSDLWEGVRVDPAPRGVSAPAGPSAPRPADLGRDAGSDRPAIRRGGVTPTDEQLQAIDLFRSGGSLAIEAGAGTGKTSTLIMLSREAPDDRGQYVAFNRSLVLESAGKFPDWVASNTAHSLAFRALGYRYKARLDRSIRMTSREVGQRLRIEAMDVTDFLGAPKRLVPSFLASLVTKAVTRFCQSADAMIGPEHFPYVEGVDDPRGLPSKNAMIAVALLPYAHEVWTNLYQLDGWVPFKHEHYLKMWQLDEPRINADYILFDEAQDANPVIAAIVAKQADHAQLVYVGDSQQEIYAWTGAVNALAEVDVEHRTFLTQSFRFGPAIARVANEALSVLRADLRLTGNPDIPSYVTKIERPRAVLARTNAAVLSRLLKEQDLGTKVHVVGGGEELARFARAVDDLNATGHTSHPDLSCFNSWDDVKAYAALDENGEDLRLMVKLVDTFSTAEIIASLGRALPEANAELILTTAHKAKGREWDTVQLGEDFYKLKPDNKAGLRLQYVAVTRAKLGLDIDALTEKKDRTPD